jgi:hypothetical protein
MSCGFVDSRFASAHKLHRAKTATTEADISCATKTGQLEKLPTLEGLRSRVAQTHGSRTTGRRGQGRLVETPPVLDFT